MAGFWSRIFGKSEREQNNASPITAIGSLPVTIVSARGDAALNVTSYARALDVLADNVANLPFNYLRLQGGCYKPFEHSSLHYLLSVQPMSRMSAHDWKYQMVWRAFHDGDAYVWPRINSDGDIAELVLLSRHSCQLDEVSGIYSVSDVVNGVQGLFGEGEIIHISFNSRDGYHGIPLWQLGSRALSIVATGDNETLERFGKGGAVRGMITNAKTGMVGFGEYSDSQLQGIAKSMEGMLDDGYNIVSIPGDADFKQFSQSSTDMQFLESRKFAVLEISRLTGVPPIYLYEPSGSNYKMPEQAYIDLMGTIDGVMKKIEAEFQRKLVAPSMCDKRIFRFDREEVNAMDGNSKASYYQKMVQMGAMTVNEVRQKFNMPPVQDGDIVYMSTNMAQLGSDKLGGGIGANSNNDNE